MELRINKFKYEIYEINLTLAIFFLQDFAQHIVGTFTEWRNIKYFSIYKDTCI